MSSEFGFLILHPCISPDILGCAGMDTRSLLDGRVARHRNLDHPCLCGSADWSLIHALRICPLFLHLRRTWLQCLQSRHYDVDLLSDDSLLRFIFAPHGMGNTRSSAHAHVLFVAGICQAQRSLPEGLGL